MQSPDFYNNHPDFSGSPGENSHYYPRRSSSSTTTRVHEIPRRTRRPETESSRSPSPAPSSFSQEDPHYPRDDKSMPSSSVRTRSASPDSHQHRHERRRRHRRSDKSSSGDSPSSDRSTTRRRKHGEERQQHHHRDERPRHSRHGARAPSPGGSTSFSLEDLLNPSNELKPWFKKKTLWASVATVATVLMLLPASVSAKGSREAAAASMAAAKASNRSAKAGEDAARASHRSARAGEKSAKAVEKSANAVVNTSIAQGHMDDLGRYIGPQEHLSRERERESRGRIQDRR